MKNCKLQLIAITAIALALTFVTTSFAKDTKLSECEARLIYSRAYEAILWASPALAIIAMDESAKRDLGAGNTETSASRRQSPAKSILIHTTPYKSV